MKKVKKKLVETFSKTDRKSYYNKFNKNTPGPGNY